MRADYAAPFGEVLASFPRALFDQVTREFRGIAGKLSHPASEAQFIDEAVGDLEQEISSEIETYVVADFFPPVDVPFATVALPPDQRRELKEQAST